MFEYINLTLNKKAGLLRTDMSNGMDILRSWAASKREEGNKTPASPQPENKIKQKATKPWRLPTRGASEADKATLRIANNRLMNLEYKLITLWEKGKYNEFWRLVFHELTHSYEWRILALHRLYPAWLREFSTEKVEKILSNSYGDLPLRKPIIRLKIPKPNGKLRPLGIPQMGSRVYFGMLAMVLSLIIDQIVSDNQHGYVPGRGIHTSWSQISNLIISNHKWLYEYDLQTFFDNLNHDLLLEMLEVVLHVPSSLIPRWRQMLNIPVSVNGVVASTEKGVPQGLAISPTLSILCLELIKFLDPIESTRIVQYSDDGIIFGKDKHEVESAAIVLAKRCRGGVAINKEKSRISHVDKDGFKFLGIRIKGGLVTTETRTGMNKILGTMEKLKDIDFRRAMVGEPPSSGKGKLTVNANSVAALVYPGSCVRSEPKGKYSSAVVLARIILPAYSKAEATTLEASLELSS
uniref:RNA-dependent DNA polymerase n=1 Tax=Powellomyces hirtus TaxID=109895 RepID=A0A4P8NPF3_9FUNG|nr:RNA-dependent DNA polymerase [Powellomyces hirtus]